MEGSVMVEQIADEITDVLPDLFTSEHAVDRSPDKLDRLSVCGGRRAGRFVSWVDWGLGVEIVVTVTTVSYGCDILLFNFFCTLVQCTPCITEHSGKYITQSRSRLHHPPRC